MIIFSYVASCVYDIDNWVLSYFVNWYTIISHLVWYANCITTEMEMYPLHLSKSTLCRSSAFQVSLRWDMSPKCLVHCWPTACVYLILLLLRFKKYQCLTGIWVISIFWQHGCHIEAKQLLHTLYGILFFQFEQSIELVKMASSIKGHHMDKF